VFSRLEHSDPFLEVLSPVVKPGSQEIPCRESEDQPADLQRKERRRRPHDRGERRDEPTLQLLSLT